MRRLMPILVLVAAPPAWAQRLEVAPLVGVTTAAGVHRTAPGVESLNTAPASSWGARGTYFLAPHLGVEALWMRQETAVSIEVGSARADVFRMTTNGFHANVVWQFRGKAARIRPFVFGGPGATVFGADDFGRNTAWSWTAGGGVKWLPARHAGVTVQGRYKPDLPPNEPGEMCGPFDFCQDRLNHFDVAAGVVLRF
jgi:hypothetical protein